MKAKKKKNFKEKKIEVLTQNQDSGAMSGWAKKRAHEGNGRRASLMHGAFPDVT